MAWPAQFHARVNYLSTILSATKVRVPVSEPSKQASKRTQLSPSPKCKSVSGPSCSPPIEVSVQQSVKERAVTIHKTQRETEKGAGLFWALLNCRSNDCKLEFDFGFILAIKMHKICKVQRFKSILSAIRLTCPPHCGCSLLGRLSSVNACKVSLRVARQSALISPS